MALFFFFQRAAFIFEAGVGIPASVRRGFSKMSWLPGHLYRESALVSSELVPHCLVLAGGLSLQGGEAGLMSPQKGRMKPQRDNCMR